ncbi:MAG: hypothetical protein QM589_04420 [Thermomicrobiales bacterium]
MSSLPAPTIELAHDSPTERETRDVLIDLMDMYPLDRWRYTDRIRISDGEIPHSHPVLTIGQTDREQPLRLLSTYIHEQLHWFWLLETHGECPFAAMDEFAQEFPGLPVGPPDGCRSAFSNLLHIAINFWELEGLSELIGRDAARSFIAGKPYYRAIYRLALEKTDRIAAILAAHDLAVPPMPPAERRFITPNR